MLDINYDTIEHRKYRYLEYKCTRNICKQMERLKSQHKIGCPLEESSSDVRGMDIWENLHNGPKSPTGWVHGCGGSRDSWYFNYWNTNLAEMFSKGQGSCHYPPSPPPNCMILVSLSEFAQSFFFFPLVVFNWQYIIQSQCCQFVFLQWRVRRSDLFWPALGSFWEEKSLSHR